MKLVLPLMLFAIGSGSGVGVGYLLRPDPNEIDAHQQAIPPNDEQNSKPQVAGDKKTDASPGSKEELEYAKLANQFVVPVIHDEKIAAMVVITVGVAVPPGGKDAVFKVEPRLRDSLLQSMFNHANIGGFSGNFTGTENMRSLRTDLLRHAKSVLGDGAIDVLILDIVRQDV